MSSLDEHLGLELVLLWDELAHAIQKLLNAHNQYDRHDAPKNKPTITVQSFTPEPQVQLNLTPDGNDYPYMPEAQTYFSRDVKYEYSESDEETRKYYSHQ